MVNTVKAEALYLHPLKTKEYHKSVMLLLPTKEHTNPALSTPYIKLQNYG